MRHRRSLIAVLVLLLLVGVVIAGRSAMRMFGRRGPPPPRQTDVTLIAGWMTVPYISRTYRVPPDQIFQSVGIPSQGNERKSLDELAAANGRSSAELVTAVQATVRDAQARQPPPGQKPGGPPGDRGPPARTNP